MALNACTSVLILVLIKGSFCQVTPQCDVVGECVGNLLGFTYEETPEECLAECKNAQDCRWYSYNADVRTEYVVIKLV